MFSPYELKLDKVKSSLPKTFDEVIGSKTGGLTLPCSPPLFITKNKANEQMAIAPTDKPIPPKTYFFFKCSLLGVSFVFASSWALKRLRISLEEVLTW